MDSDRERELVTVEQTRIGQALAVLDRPGSQEASDRIEPGDGGSEDVYQDEFDAGRAEGLHRRLASLERAEARPEAGNYQLPVESGDREWCDQ